MVKFAMTLFFISFSDLIMAKTLLIETESSEEENGNFIENGSGYMIPQDRNYWRHVLNGNDYNDCKNLRECVQQKIKKRNMRPTRIDPLGKGK